MALPKANSSSRDKRLILRKRGEDFEYYRALVDDLLKSELVKSMAKFMQHGDLTCLDHCLHVSYVSFRCCRLLGLDFRSAARGALLHDFFLYDWHSAPPGIGPHVFVHPSIALKNASVFDLNVKEKDIIKKHMWPLTVIPPRCLESLVVCIVDKSCTIAETTGLGRRVFPDKAFIYGTKRVDT